MSERRTQIERGIARIKAEAWDEGHHAGRNGHGRFVNPYREEQGDE